MSNQTVEGSLLDARVGIIVHGCNAQGVMGSGVAAAVRSCYPQAYKDYRQAYEKQGSQLGVGQIIWTKVSSEPKLAVANAITQKFYGRDPKVVYVDYDALGLVFEKIGVAARRWEVPVHYPMIGAGLANGDWSVILPLIEKGLQGVEHTLWLPKAAPTQVSRPRPR